MSNFHNLTDQELIRHVDNMLEPDPLMRELADRFDAVLGALEQERKYNMVEKSRYKEQVEIVEDVKNVLAKAGEL